MYRRRILSKSHLDIFALSAYLLISGLLLAFSTGGFALDFKSMGFSVMSGAQRGVFSLTSFVSGSITAVRELSELRTKYEELTEKLSDYELLQRNNVDIRLENERLKTLLGFAQTLETKNIFSQVVGRDPNNQYSGITLDRGSKDGVRKNMPVIAFQGSNIGLVGKVVQVGRTTSLVMPVFDYQCFVSVRFVRSRFEGLVNGQGSPDSPLIMKYVKKRAREEIQEGDIISTSGENYLYPKDIPVGFVSKIRGLEYETSLDIEIESIIDFSRLEHVFILDTTISAEGDD